MRTIKYLSKEVYVMKKVITANQIKEIEKLIPEHGDALIGIAVGEVATLIFFLSYYCKEKKNSKDIN